jgi:hypothetical protein
MSLLTLMLLIVVVGVGLWALNKYVPMQPQVKQILNIVVILILVYLILKATGIWAALGRITL